MSILIVVAVLGLSVVGGVIGLAWLDGGREEVRLIELPATLPDAAR